MIITHASRLNNAERQGLKFLHMVITAPKASKEVLLDWGGNLPVGWRCLK
jgi:hypothetical protein